MIGFAFENIAIMALELKELLKKHYGKGCLEVEGQRVEIPTPAEKLKFNHHFKELRHPCDFCADFESLTTTKNISTYVQLSRAKPCGFMLHSVNAVDNEKHVFFAKGS